MKWSKKYHNVPLSSDCFIKILISISYIFYKANSMQKKSTRACYFIDRTDGRTFLICSKIAPGYCFCPSFFLLPLLLVALGSGRHEMDRKGELVPSFSLSLFSPVETAFHRLLRVLNNYYFESESIYVTAAPAAHEKRETQHRPLCNCGPDSASFPAAMLYHFLYTSLVLSLLVSFSLFDFRRVLARKTDRARTGVTRVSFYTRLRTWRALLGFSFFLFFFKS